MDPAAALLTLGVGIIPNATWDAIKALANQLARDRTGFNAEEIFRNTLLDSLNRYDNKSEEGRLADTIKYRLETDRDVISRAFSDMVIDDLGAVAASLDVDAIATQAVRHLVDHLTPDLRSDETIQLATDIIGRAVAGFRARLMERLNHDDATRVILAQCLKIDVVLDRLENTLDPGLTAEIQAAASGITSLKKAIENVSATWASIESSHPGQADTVDIPDLCRRTQRLFQAKGYQIAPITSEWQNAFAAELKTLFGQRYIVGCAPGENTTQDVFDFDRATWPLREFRRVLILPGSTPAPENMHAVGPSLTVMNYSELLLQDADITSYLRDLVARYEFGMIHQKDLYIVPRVTFDDDINSDVHFDADMLTSSPECCWLILGDFGTGKTTLLEHIAYSLSQLAQVNIAKAQFPVVLKVADLDRLSNIASLIFSVFSRSGYEIGLPTVRELLREGRLAIFIDGLDEVPLWPDSRRLTDFLNELVFISNVQRNRVLITCRTHYFRTQLEEHFRPEVSVARIKAWNPTQIRQFLIKAGADQSVTDIIRTVPRVAELATIPIFIEMLLRLSASALQGLQSPAHLYGQLTESWIREQHPRSRMSMTQKATFLEGLAVHMAQADVATVHYTELRELVQQIFKLTSIDDLDYFDHDARTCTFLIRDSEGRYRFSHRSFRDYFLAKVIAEGLDALPSELDPNLITAASWGSLLARRKLDSAVWEFASDLIHRPQVLEALAQAAISNTDSQLLPANLLGILRCGSINIPQFSLARGNLRDVDFRRSNLAGVDFTNASFYSANLNDSVIDGADFRGADMRRCSIKPSIGVYRVVQVDESSLAVAPVGVREARIIDLAAGSLARNANQHRDELWALATSPDKTLLASGGRDHQIVVWNLTENSVECTLEGHYDNVWAVAWAPSGRRLASGGSDARVAIWEVGKYPPSHAFRSHSDEVRGVDFVNEDVVVSCSLDGTIGLYSFNEDRLMPRIINVLDSDPLLALAVDRRSSVCYVGSQSGYVAGVSIPDGAVTFTRKVSNSSIRAILYQQNSSQIFVGDAAGSIKCLSGNSVAEVSEGMGVINSLSWFSGTNQLLVGSYDGYFVLSDAGEKSAHIAVRNETREPHVSFSCIGAHFDSECGLETERLQLLEQAGALIDWGADN